MQLAEAAIAYRRAGLSVLPARIREKRPALSTWKAFQTRLPSEAEATKWFSAAEGLCLIAGAVSGNLEMLDFDLAGEAFSAWYERVCVAAPQLLAKLVIEQSPSGGWHVIYRCESPVCGNQKLAQRKQLVDGPEEATIAGKSYKPRQDADGQWHVLLTMIETRGEGGLFLCAPTPGYELFQGDIALLPVLADEERELLLQSAWSLNAHFSAGSQSEQSPPASLETRKSPAEQAGGCTPPADIDSRPGDDFNQRGDVRSVLRKHGWTLAKGGDNEYWRRPGKASGSSATLKDGVFYVFSSSAAPFEEGRGYAPFSVYTLLEHHGDFSVAAAALRLDGFGGDVATTAGVDLAEFERRLRLGEMRRMVGLPAEEPPPAAENNPPPASQSPKIPSIPEELLRVPGFVGDVMEFCLAAARYPSVPLAFCGAMALQSFLSSRKVREQGGLRPNLYMLALADSGTGKAYPRKINSYVLGKLGLGGAVGNQIASGQGLEDEMQSHRKMLFQTDEVDHLLRCLSSTKETYYSMLLGMLLQLYTEADEVHSMRTRARDKGRPNQVRGEIDQPGLVIFGTATPECFFEAMSPRLLTNGLFSRSIIVDVPNRARKQMSRDVSELPDHLLEVARWWKDYNPGPLHPITGRKPNLDDEHPVPAVVPYSEDGFAVLDRFGTHADDEYDAAREAGDQVRAIIWTRASENATRLALVYACSRNHLSPCIDLAAAQWATRFVDHLVRRMLYLASLHVAANPFHAECLKLLRKLREAPDQQMQRQHLLRTARCKASDFDQMIATLVQQGDIVPAEIPTKTKSALGYRLA
jgi:hypothetical protein